MYYSDRREKILAYIKEHQKCSVHSLSKELFVSEPTIRRDLTELEREGKIKRTYGGAVYGEVLNREIPFDLRKTQNTRAKRIVAEKAAALLQDGQTVFLDASSTVSHLIPYLSAFRNITVITNGPKVSLMLAEKNIRTICTGGLLLNQSLAFVGAQAIDAVRCYNTDIAFFSARGVTEDGLLTDSSLEETMFRKAMLRQAAVKVCLCIADKVGKRYACNLCSLTEIDDIISDGTLPQAFHTMCRVL